MFIGHYAPSFVGAASPKIKLWQAFIAVQFIDLIWAIFIITGIERGRIEPGFTASNPIDLYFMPYSHSLLFCVFWAVVGAIGFKWLTRQSSWMGAMIFGVLVMSHWLGDFIVHVKDLPLWPGSGKVGLGVWHSLVWGLVTELGLLAICYAFYLSRTQKVMPRATLWAVLFFAFLCAVQLINVFGTTPPSMHALAFTALGAFIALALLAWRFERSRRHRLF